MSIALPENREVVVGEMANFSCSAYGSYIDIFWGINDQRLTCNESGCDNEVAATVQEHNNSFSEVNKNITIESTLYINTTGLPLDTIVIACVIVQDTPADVQGTAAPDGTFSALLEIRGPTPGKWLNAYICGCLTLILRAC